METTNIRENDVRILSLIASGLAAAGLIAGCGAEAPSGPRLASRIEACSLIGPAEISRALGAEMFQLVTPPPRGGGDGEAYATSCAFMTSRGEAETMDAFREAAQATVTIWSWRDATGAESVLANARARPGRPPEPLDGLGEAALWNGATVVRDGAVVLVVTVDARLDRAADQAAERAIAEAALARLAQLRPGRRRAP